ncbi:hypothetical protein HU830_06095 [Lactobacillus sp. DCY120]|uniref:SAP domain-containing protein n=1 Tax=Bombilactobacillus apium TaxID=2675299 RepID=A0A850R7A7_9LACO|nr:hypothetical protein [Bombilactobacillus apium]
MCRQYHLPTTGTKAELNSYLEQYLSGIPQGKIRAKRVKQTAPSLTADQITLQTPVVDAGLKFNAALRQFLGSYFQVKQFKFTKEMAMIKRQAERDHDCTLTLGQLLEQADHLQKNPEKKRQLAEEQTYQWNQFVRDFFADPQTRQFEQRLQVAANLWQQLKQSPQAKKYRPELLQSFNPEDLVN